jgi:hypothetical protein
MSFQTYTCPQCHRPYEFYQQWAIVPPCPGCGYPELKASGEDYYRSMGCNPMNQPTQEQMFYQEQRKIADGDLQFLEFVKDGTMNKVVLRRLIQRRPELWSRYANWLDGDRLPEGDC